MAIDASKGSTKFQILGKNFFYNKISLILFLQTSSNIDFDRRLGNMTFNGFSTLISCDEEVVFQSKTALILATFPSHKEIQFGLGSTRSLPCILHQGETCENATQIVLSNTLLVTVKHQNLFFSAFETIKKTGDYK